MKGKTKPARISKPRPAGGAWLALGCMLAAAALALWGGERLARRTVEERQPIDRTRLLDFSTALAEELDRLATVYQGHLSELEAQSLTRGMTKRDIEQRCDRLVGMRSLTVWDASGKKLLEAEGRRSAVRVPEPVLSGDTGFHSARTVELPPLAPETTADAGGWRTADDGRHRLRWRRRAADGMIFAAIIDDEEVQPAIESHLRTWAESGPAALLKGTQERVELRGMKGVIPVFAQVAKNAAPGPTVIPHRTVLGAWQVQGWDGLQWRTEHDSATLILAGAVACILVLAGIYLEVGQRRALRLAEQRVSFVNRVSHELGTPLTNILLNLELSLRALEARPEDARRRLGLVDEEVRRLARLVANVLTFSRRERGTLNLRQGSYFPPETVLEEILGQYEAALARAGIRVERLSAPLDPAGLRMAGDGDAFAQIIGNLVGNVEKYAAAGGWLGWEMELSSGADGQRRLTVRVADRGPGIPVRARERIFLPFERAGNDAVAEGASGTGLGLAIARELAGRMGGSLNLETEAGEGAVFVLSLPVVTPPELAVVNRDGGKEGESAA